VSQAPHPHRRSRANRPAFRMTPFRITQLAAACALTVAGSPGALAQQAAAGAAPAVQTIVVKGIRSSLESSLDLKRNGQGVVDGISAEDIGKFPDTNLAESLQRISGVSIDRSNGEGSRVTVRGVGPEFNLVLLNGRQMPASSIADTNASGSRAFDFGNLASEAIAGIEVYKTSRASSPTGGIGATINIKTARPLENPGLRGSFGVKGVVDTSNGRLPSTMAGDEFTPEVSGIYSNTFGNGKFGVALSASYQERDLGYNQAAVAGGWYAYRGNQGPLASPNANLADITNKPGADDLYSLPQNLVYSVNGVQRQRTNGQLTLQYAPMKNLTATLDFTYSELKLQTKRNELSAWFTQSTNSSSVWTNGPIASPIFYSETIGPGNSPLRRGLEDLAMAGADFATKNENESTGVNVAWKFSDRLKFEFDVHSSTAESGADSPFGSNNVLGTASYNRATTSADFSQDFPVLSIYDTSINPALMKVAGSSFRNSYMKSGVDQAQVKGQFKLAETSKLDFGVSLTRVKNRSAFSAVDDDDWGGRKTDVTDFPDHIWRADQIRPYFSQISGSGNPALFNQFFTWDFKTVRDLAAKARPDTPFLPSNSFTTDGRVEEKSQSAYLHYTMDWDTKFPMRTAFGVRHEKTDITSTAQVPDAIGINWTSNDDFSVLFASSPGSTTLKGSYSHFLPSIDFDIDVTDNMKFRASYGETIGRPGWDAIQGGQNLAGRVRVDGGTGSQGNPGLKPLKSKNFDLSFEWYYAKGSYAAVSYFKKDISNFITDSIISATPFNLNTPVKGPLWNEAVAARCPTESTACIREYIFERYDGQFGIDRAAGIIPGRPGDPIATFALNSKKNSSRASSLDGLEFNVQHMFGRSGFGMQANYTMVNSDLKYKDGSLGEQLPLVGLSDSANLVLFYENDKWQVRAAYNWRDRFLTALQDGPRLNPVYTEAYGQLDINASYKLTERLTVHAEVINATDGTQRLHGRSKSQVLYVTQTGPRYMFGANYKF